MSEYKPVTDNVNRWNYWTVTRDIQERAGHINSTQPSFSIPTYVRARYLTLSVKDKVGAVRYDVVESLEQAE